MIDWKKVFSIYATFGIPLLYLYNIYLAYTFPHTLFISWQLQIFGLLLTLCGVVMWTVSYINLGWSFGVLPQKQKRVTKGLYKYVSHPMYIAIYLTFLGLSLSNTSLPGLLFLTLILVPILTLRATLEEKNLT